MMFANTKQEIFALQKDTFISVSIDLSESMTQNTQSKQDKSVDLPLLKEEQTEPSNAKAKDVDVGDLFNKVWTKDITKEKVQQIKPHENKRFQEIQKRLKKSEQKEQASITKKLQELTDAKENSAKSSSSKGDAVNEYRAKIQALVYQHFHPPQNSQGYSVRALIKLSALGNVLDFRILNYSANQALNDESDRVKRRLMGVLFPVNPNNESGNYIIILKAEE